MPFTQAATDLISERIGELTKCGARDVAQEFPASRQWLSAFGLSVIFLNSPPEPTRPLALQIIRHIEMAFAEYTSAVQSLTELIEARSSSNGVKYTWSPYYRALYHFEAAIAQLYLTYDNGKKSLGQKYFEGGDGSFLDRLNSLYNTAKHVIADTEQPLWITDNGIRCEKNSVSFHEIEDQLRDYGRMADRLINQTQNIG